MACQCQGIEHLARERDEAEAAVARYEDTINERDSEASALRTKIEMMRKTTQAVLYRLEREALWNEGCAEFNMLRASLNVEGRVMDDHPCGSCMDAPCVSEWLRNIESRHGSEITKEQYALSMSRLRDEVTSLRAKVERLTHASAPTDWRERAMLLAHAAYMAGVNPDDGWDRVKREEAPRILDAALRGEEE